MVLPRENRTENYIVLFDGQIVYQYDETLFAILICISIICTVLTSTINSLFLITVIKTNYTKSTYQKLYTCLAITDLLLGLTSWPSIVVLFARLLSGDCNIKVQFAYTHCWSTILLGISFSIIFLITLDQYLSVTHPFFYERNISFKRLTIVICVMTFTNLVTNIAVLTIDIQLNSKVLEPVSAGIIFIAIIQSAFMYMRVFRVIQKSQRRIKDLTLASKQGSQLKSKLKAIKNILIAYLAVLICFSPCGTYFILGRQGSFIDTYVFLPALLLAATSSIWDLLIFYLRYADIRCATKTVLKQCY